MMRERDAQARLQRLQAWRNRPDPDLSLGFLSRQFQQQIAKPHKQLGKLAELWEQLLPPELLAHTQLLGLTRGTLRVGVDSSAHLYELDRLLRTGLQRQLVAGCKTIALRKIHLQLHGAPQDIPGNTSPTAP